MYKVIQPFSDLQDGGRVYRIGDEFPCKGAKASKERIAELAGSENKQGRPLIEAVPEGKKSAVEGDKASKPRKSSPTAKKQPKKAKKG